ncbi:MAG: glucose-6-phosphate isomerase [Streptosporangiales bacterium]|nr:glucose-6-phosphate isomerase [Streptosporangiales bacterium]
MGSPAAGAVSVHGAAYSDVLTALIQDQVATKLVAKDATLWGPAAEAEAAIRLGWIDLAHTSRPLLAEIDALRAELREEGLDHVVLCGMGGSSLAPEVITATAGVELTVLDSTDPGTVRRALGDRLERTVVVVSSKSGTTVETDSQRRAYAEAFAAAGIDAPSRFVVVTDPGSALAELGEQEGYRKVFLADPNVGGRYSALTAFGLVPAGLTGVDVSQLLDDAEELLPQLAGDTAENPGLVLGAVLGGAHAAGRDKVVLGAGDSPVAGFPAWAEQLIAESTGKDDRGLLPVDVGAVSGDTPGWTDAGDDATKVAIGAAAGADVTTDGPLGAQLLLWEAAVAVAGRVIDINPFDQPNVEEAKKQARALLDNPTAGDGLPHAFTEGAVEVYGDPDTLRGDQTLAYLFASLHYLVPETGYLALQAYLDREADAAAERLRAAVAARSGVQTTFGWGPRFLHSTGQYHKGGHQNGGFVQLTGAVADDLAVPDRPYSFGSLIAAQAAGDLAVLRQKGRPVVRLHLTDRAAGLRQLLEAATA